MPWLLVRVALTLTTSAAFPGTVKGTVNVNWLPYGFDAELLYQVVNAEPSCTVTGSRIGPLDV